MKEQISILYPKGTDFSAVKKISAVTWHDLGMDLICEKITEKEDEREIIRRVMMNFTKDSKVSSFRADIFQDIINHPSLREQIIKLLKQIHDIQDYMSLKRNIDKTDGIWTLMRRLKEVRDYIACVEMLEKCLADAKLQSEGLLQLKEYVTKIQVDSSFAELKEDIAKLELDTGKVKSVTLGINLNDNYEAESVGVISLNQKAFSKANVLSSFHQKIKKEDQIQTGYDWNGKYSFQPVVQEQNNGLSTIDKTMLTFTAALNPLMGIGIGLSRIRSNTPEEHTVEYLETVINKMLGSTVREMKEILSKYATVSIFEIVGLIPEFTYYILWAEYIEKLRQKGYRFEKANVDTSTGNMNAKGIYNLKLATISETPVHEIIGNELFFDDAHSTYILTGANRGGKTTITQAIGQLYVLAQGGIYIPGESFEFSPIDGIYTHFPSDEEKTMNLGRLGEECTRFKEIFQECTFDSLLLLNGTFSTTSFEEGYYIAFDALRAILCKGVRTIYNTHMHKLAKEVDVLNENSDTCKAASLIVKSENGRRSYKVEIAPAEGISYADDIARKFGVTFEQLIC